MDDRRFDSLVRALAEGKSRRSVLKGLLGLGGAALVGSAALDGDADAARRPTPTPTPVQLSRQANRGQWRSVRLRGPTGAWSEQMRSRLLHREVTDSLSAPAGHSECCDNACCFGTCYGEELCCPPTRVRRTAADPPNLRWAERPGLRGGHLL